MRRKPATLQERQILWRLQSCLHAAIFLLCRTLQLFISCLASNYVAWSYAPIQRCFRDCVRIHTRIHAVQAEYIENVKRCGREAFMRVPVTNWKAPLKFGLKPLVKVAARTSVVNKHKVTEHSVTELSSRLRHRTSCFALHLLQRTSCTTRYS